jgi:hypothetical protein
MPDQIAGLRPDRWQPFDLEAGDGEVLGAELIERYGHLLQGKFAIITDMSWRTTVGPLTTAASQLIDFIRGHADRSGEAFFAGDVVIVSWKTGVVIVVHHNGLVQAVHGQPATEPPLPG